jgi:hypothetical protein
MGYLQLLIGSEILVMGYLQLLIGSEILVKVTHDQYLCETCQTCLNQTLNKLESCLNQTLK